MKYKRQISDNEYVYLAAGRVFSDLIIKTHIVGHGTLSQNRLQEAVDLVNPSFPGACLQKMGSYWESTSSPPRVKYLDVFPTNQSNFYTLINSSLGLNPFSGPTCDILMHRNGKKTS